MWELYVAICLILLTLLLIYFRYRRKQYVQYLKDSSISLKKLFELNKEYSFFKITVNPLETHKYDNEIFYNSISCEDYLIYQLQFSKYILAKELKYTSDNRKYYQLYCKEIDNIYNLGEYDYDNNRLNKKYLLKLEKKLFEQHKQKPKLQIAITVHLFQTKINGENLRSKRETFNEDQIKSLISRLDNKSGNFYRDREIWDAICRVERGKVSNKMRFAIYKRDGYRCKICGRSQGVTSLEIDHIKPIAKGGKTTYDNLQTLCTYCNKEKGDKY